MESTEKEIKDWKTAVHIMAPEMKVVYVVLKEPSEPERAWVMGAKVDGRVIGQGKARKKKEAEQLAARDIIALIKQKRREAARARGQARNELGRRSEEIVIQALAVSGDDTPSWFHSVRHGTKEEDRNGVDVVIETHDLGKLLIQVKSSSGRAVAFTSKGRRSRLIGIVVVEWHETVSEIRNKVFTTAEELRRAILIGRNQ